MTEERDDAIELNIKALKDPDQWVRAHAANALIETPDARIIEPLINALSDEEPHVRMVVATCLGFILDSMRDTRAVTPLINALGDTNDRVRVWAAIGLGKLGDARAIKPLESVLRDKDSRVRESAAEALNKIAAGQGATLLRAADGREMDPRAVIDPPPADTRPPDALSVSDAPAGESGEGNQNFWQRMRRGRGPQQK